MDFEFKEAPFTHADALKVQACTQCSGGHEGGPALYNHGCPDCFERVKLAVVKHSRSSAEVLKLLDEVPRRIAAAVEAFHAGKPGAVAQGMDDALREWVRLAAREALSKDPLFSARLKDKIEDHVRGGLASFLEEGPGARET